MIADRKTFDCGADQAPIASGTRRAPLGAMRSVRAAFAVGGLYTEGSGVTRIVCDLANALLRRGSAVDVYTADCPGRGADGRWLDAGNRLHAVPGRWCGRLAWSPGLKRLLDDSVSQFDVVHNHGLWMLPTSYAARAALRNDVPVVYTVHGFLEPWALAHSSWKKRLAGWGFQNRDLRRAACIHVNSRAELAGVRTYGLKNPVAIIPNGIDPPGISHSPPREVLERRFPEVRGKRVCLFLSRLHEKKGLGHLVEAWSRVRREFDDWHLLIAGPDDGYETQLRARIAALGLDQSIGLTGALYGTDKQAACEVAELFVLPSFSEGFSMAVLEALSAGLPVLMTPGCNFPEAIETGAGIEVEPTAESTADGLHRLLSRTRDELAAMGARGRALVEAAYTWDQAAQRLLSVYRWLNGGGPRPDDVVTD
jgi:glycosyltransferase involved in cell wall biosynthesis